MLVGNVHDNSLCPSRHRRSGYLAAKAAPLGFRMFRTQSIEQRRSDSPRSGMRRYSLLGVSIFGDAHQNRSSGP